MAELYQDINGKQVIAGPNEGKTAWCIYETKKERVDPKNESNKQVKEVLEPIAELPVLEFKATYYPLNKNGLELLKTQIVEKKEKKKSKK